ncbi:ExeM/NucH family extracellular endonuclease [Corynebacterium callunae]|uniref:ExeM/NucH family extracellular endonuclease n=1 Tax=Corynebacterium callunae TaxID=1721 RepID=UPI003981CCCD
MTRISARTLALALAGATAASLAVAPAATAKMDGTLPVITEVYGGGGNSGSVYSNDFIELYNPTDAAISLDGWSVAYYSASGNPGGTTTLTGSIAPGSYYLIQQNAGSNNTGALPAPDAIGTLSMSGSNGAVELKNASSEVVDLVGYGSANQFEGVAAAPATSNSTSVQRKIDVVDLEDNSLDFLAETPTPKAPFAGDTDTPAEPSTPGTITSIADIQGTGAETPLAGQIVTTKGIVTAVYAEGGFNGYYIQTPGTGATLKSAGQASDGIFVYVGSNGTYPAIGDSVTVTGTAAEYYDMTQLGNSSYVPSPIPFEAVTPTALDTVPAGDDIREAYEGMLLQPTGAHTVTNNYGLNTYGEIALAPGTEPLYQATEMVAPGQAAIDYEAANAAKEITLDDGRSGNYTRGDNTVPMPWIVQDSGSTIKAIRTGDQVNFQTPVIFDYRFDLWKFQPTTPVTGNTAADELPITWEDSRAAELASIDTVAGDYHIASFNVLNYFTSLGEDEAGCAAYTDIYGDPVTANNCDVRGAFSDEALADQQAKIVAAINRLDVDVLGLEEIENTATVTGDKTHRDEALNTLVAALNAAAGSDRWAAVESPAKLGTDEDYIRVAFIYDKTTVKPVGESRIFDDAAFTGTARQPLAQEFQPLDETKESFVGVVNHFKSKGSVANGDADTGDGQGSNANVRVAQAQALIKHLEEQDDWASKPVFILGDTNSYAREDSMTTLYDAGYSNIAEEFDAGYSYQFDGRIGSLDHALGNAAAMDNVVDAEVWDINADESIAFEYSRRLNNITDVYTADPFRSSDHDPIKVGFNLKSVEAPVDPGTEEPADGSSDSAKGLGIFAIIAAILAAIGFALPYFKI